MGHGHVMLTRQSPRGTGLTRTFYSHVVPHFRKNRNRLVKAFLGSACEQWINGECFQALIGADRSLWVRPERYKHDLVIFTSEEDAVCTPARPALIIESKVVYGSESESVQSAKLEALARQLRVAESKYVHCRAIGFIVCFDWQYRVGDDRALKPCRNSTEGRRLVGRSKWVGLEDAGGRTGGARLADKHRIRMGKYEYVVDCTLAMVRAVANS